MSCKQVKIKLLKKEEKNIKSEVTVAANHIRISTPILRELLNVEKEKTPTTKLPFEYDGKKLVIYRKGEHPNETF
jgi:hypothetical protein